MKILIYLCGGIFVELLASNFNDEYQRYTYLYMLLISMVLFIVMFNPQLAELRLRNIYAKVVEVVKQCTNRKY